MMEGYFRCVTKVQLQDLKTGLCFVIFIIIFMLIIDNKK